MVGNGNSLPVVTGQLSVGDIFPVSQYFPLVLLHLPFALLALLPFLPFTFIALAFSAYVDSDPGKTAWPSTPDALVMFRLSCATLASDLSSPCLKTFLNCGILATMFPDPPPVWWYIRVWEWNLICVRVVSWMRGISLKWCSRCGGLWW